MRLREMSGRAAGAGLLGVAICAQAAMADTVAVPVTAVFVTNQTLTIDLTVPSNVAGDATLDLTYAGDLNGGTGGGQTEALDVSVEGPIVATALTTVSGCVTDSTTSITIPESVLQSAASDGTVTLTFSVTPGPSQSVSAICGGSFAFNAAGPFVVFNGGPDAAYAVTGTLNFSVAAAADTTAAITDFLGARGAMMLRGGLDHQRRVDRLRQAGAPVSRTISFDGYTLVSDAPIDLAMSENSLQFASTSAMGSDATFWSEGSVSFVNDATTDDARFSILHFGMDWQRGPDTAFGVGIQIDRMEQTLAGTGEDLSGTGWMVGPTLTQRIRDDLYFDGRLAFGRADNDIDGESFDSERALLDVAVIGDLIRGPFTVSPEARLAYVTETQEAFAGNPETTVAQGLARLGARVSRPVALGQSEAIAYLEVDSVYTHFYEGSFGTGAYASEIDGWSGAVAFGTQITHQNGWSFDLEAGVGGLGTDADATTLLFMARKALN